MSPADQTDDDEPKHGEHTGKVILAAQEAVHAEMGTVKRIQFWVTLGLTIAGLGFGGAMFLNRYANAADLDRLAEKADETNRALTSHITAESSRQSALEVQTKNIEEDYHWQREQLQRIADRVGAARVPAPSIHEKRNP